VAVATLLLLPALAQAHPGHGHPDGFAAGALHPFTGIDHLAGLLTAGVLMGLLKAQARWLICAAFLALLGGTHSLWVAPAAGAGGYLAGMMFMSTTLLAAGMAASRLLRVTAAVER
jgi:hydrogenase/urease accessory protein HupE